MDIAMLSMAMSQADFTLQKDVAVMSKFMDLNEQVGDTLVKMMEQSVTPELGQNIDIRL